MFEKDIKEEAEKRCSKYFQENCYKENRWADTHDLVAMYLDGYNKSKEDADKMKSQFLELCNLKDMRIAKLEKANEWHYMKDVDCYEDLHFPPKEEEKGRVLIWKVQVITENGIKQPVCYHCGSYGDLWYEMNAYHVIAWKETVPPESLCDKILENLKQNHEKYVQEGMQFHDVGVDDEFRKQQKEMKERNCENCGSVHCYSFEPKYHICKNGSLWTDMEEE